MYSSVTLEMALAIIHLYSYQLLTACVGAAIARLALVKLSLDAALVEELHDCGWRTMSL